MYTVNIDSIMQKVMAFSNSPSGQKLIKERVRQYQESGTKKTAAGSRIITEKDLYDAANKMIEILTSTAQSYALPESVMRHFGSLQMSKAVPSPGGGSMVAVYFGDDLHRDSLVPESYDGVRNIVALLNNGYHARDYVYGWWDGHSPTGASAGDLRNAGADGSAYIRSRKDREGLGFIQQAVADFNRVYGSYYNVTARPSQEYLE